MDRSAMAIALSFSFRKLLRASFYELKTFALNNALYKTTP
jgi:hypothetical protein